jgi:outer membrane receptor for ferrienterochelin and colicins
LKAFPLQFRARRFAAGVGVLTLAFLGSAQARGQDVDPAQAATMPSLSAPTTQSTEPADLGAPVGEEGSELMLFKDIPVVVAAGMRQQTLQQAPASVSVVDANDIQLFNYRSLADVLRAQRSFYIYNNGLDTFTGVRGIQIPGNQNSQILVLEDGRPMNELVNGATGVEQGFGVPMEAIKQVEVVRGPGSSLYGTNAMFGVVNVVTKAGADVNGVVEKTEVGTDETIHQNILYGQQFKDGWDVLADVSGFTTAGDRDILYDGITDPALDDGHIRDSDNTATLNGFAKIKNGPFTFQIDSTVRHDDDSTATYLTSFYNPGWVHEQQTNATLKLDHDFSNGQELHAMVYYTHYDSRLASPYDTTQVPVPYTYYTNASDDFIGEQIHYGWQINNSFHLLAGADGTEAIETRQDDSDTLTGAVLNVPASYSGYGLFAEGTDQLFDWFSLTVGARFDEVQRVGTHLSPRIAAIFTPTKKDTIKALYGSAFRSPTLSDLLYQTPPPSGVIDNPKLKPETIDTYELAWERQYDNGWQTSVNGYLWNMSDEITTVALPDGSTQQQNGAGLTTEGLEVEADKKWDSGGSIRAYATYGHAFQDGSTLVNSPDWITGTSIAIPVLRKDTFLTIEPQIVGQQKNDLGESTPPTFLTNVVFTSRDLWKGWTFQAGLYNLFGNFARYPREGPFNQVETSLNGPNPEALVSLSCKF